MRELIDGFGKAFGSAFGQSLGAILVKIIVVFLLAFLALAALGILFFGLVIFFYKKRKRKSFLASGLLSSLSFSLVVSVILSSKITHDFSLAVILAPVLFIAGLVLTIYKYRKRNWA